jgi:hypothetical protein
VVADFQSPDNIESPSLLIDYELGGVALNNPLEGLRKRVWILEVDKDTGDFVLSAPENFPVTLFTAPGTTEASLTFDQNMRPVVAYVQEGVAKFYWYDTVLGAAVTTVLASDVRNPKCCLDDKRPYQTAQGSNDVILAYLRGTGLYYRQQRDRFETEYLLKDPIPGSKLLRVGMNSVWRLQFELEG